MKKDLVIKKNSVGEYFFFISLAIFLVITILDSSFFCKMFSSNFVKVCMYTCIVLSIFKETLNKKIKLKELIFLCICLFLSIILAYHLNMITMLPVFFLIYSGRNIELEKILRFIKNITIVLLLIIIVSSKLGIITNYVNYMNGRIREYLGFRYCLFPAMYMFNISAISLYLNRKKFSILNVVILTVLNYMIFNFTDSRLSFYLYLILLFGYVFLSIPKCYKFIEKRKFVRRLMISSFIIIAIISFIVTIFYDSNNDIYVQINKVLESRLNFGKAAIDEYGISLFGNNVKFNGNGLGRNGINNVEDYNYVDCLYLTITIKYGIIFCILYLLLHTLTLYNINKNKDYLLLFIFFIIALHGTIDDLGLELYYNAFWFAIGTNILNLKNKKV